LRFGQLFCEFERRLSPTMRQQHAAGHKTFVDYSGKLVPITDPVTGAVGTEEIFVAVLGASSPTYAEANPDSPNWTCVFRYASGSPEDTAKSDVPIPCEAIFANRSPAEQMLFDRAFAPKRLVGRRLLGCYRRCRTGIDATCACSGFNRAVRWP
jgi:hypothetical protein